ncbi:MAG: (Fe-S)-binding protein [Thermoguttaceae bacterium]|nr:(Fe-S)-binding protein [Thermoguttaceae bacterium]
MISALERAVPNWTYPEYKAGEEVALFIPCFIDQFFPEAGVATVKILEKLGIPLVYPDEQTCCGQPAFNSGYWDDARKVMDKFEKVFNKYKWIVTPSSACASMCRVFYKEAAPQSPAVAVGARVYELSEFLAKVLGKTDFGARFPHKVAMHIGCHGRRELGIAAAAQALLENVRDLEYVPIPNVEECCGFGGTFSVKMPGTSIAMGKKKIENIRQVYRQGVRHIVTTDLSCAMHFGGMMRRDAELKEVQIHYIAELLVD